MSLALIDKEGVCVYTLLSNNEVFVVVARWTGFLANLLHM